MNAPTTQLNVRSVGQPRMRWMVVCGLRVMNAGGLACEVKQSPDWFSDGWIQVGKLTRAKQGKSTYDDTIGLRSRTHTGRRLTCRILISVPVMDFIVLYDLQ